MRQHPLPTDLQILNAIYNRYYLEFKGGAEDAPPIESDTAAAVRESKIYVPIDIASIASDLGVDPDIVFGRLYYFLDYKHRYEHEGAKVHLFARKVGRTRHAVNFPYMASVLAQMREENKKYQVATWMAGVSLALSVIAIVVAAMTGGGK